MVGSEFGCGYEYSIFNIQDSIKNGCLEPMLVASLVVNMNMQNVLRLKKMGDGAMVVASLVVDMNVRYISIFKTRSVANVFNLIQIFKQI